MTKKVEIQTVWTAWGWEDGGWRDENGVWHDAQLPHNVCEGVVRAGWNKRICLKCGALRLIDERGRCQLVF